MAVVVTVTDAVLVDTSSVVASELSRGTQPTVRFVTEVSAVVELVAHVDSQNTPEE